MWQKIKNLWRLSDFVPTVEGDKTVLVKDKNIEGDGVFFSEGTQEEYEEFQREEQGLKGIFGIGL